MRYKKIIVFLLLFCIVLANCDYIAHAEQGGGLLAAPNNITAETTDEGSGTEEAEGIGETEETDAITEADETGITAATEEIEVEAVVEEELYLGTGTAQDPFIIYDAEAFLDIRNNLSAFYKLGTDIDFGGETITTMGFSAAPFKGGLDGDGYAIKNFKINRSGAYAGLFGYASSAKMKNLVIENAEIIQSSTSSYIGALAGCMVNCTTENISLNDITVSGGLYSGALAGYVSGGSFTGCNAAGSVSVTGKTEVGGLVGVVNNTTISNCSVSGTGVVTGTGNVGGLFGDMSNGSVARCFAAIDVNGGDNTGGLVGRVTGASTNARANINECYATGNITGKANIGGLVGSDSYGTISDCFAMGSVTSTTNSAYAAGILGYTGGVIIKNCYATGRIGAGGSGIIYNTSVTSCYFDTVTTGITAVNNGLGKMTAALLRKATYISWDFDSIWDIAEGATYPFLRNIKEPDWPQIDTDSLPVGSGAAEDPYLIGMAGQFQYINYDLTACYKLTADIDFKNEVLTPIGTSSAPFKGTFEGDGHTIKNYKINKTDAYAGLFGYTSLATIQNLVIENAEVKQPAVVSNAGALAGGLINSTTKNITLIDITVASGGASVGTLAGYVSGGSITECTVAGSVSVTGQNQVGGLVGSATIVNTSDCAVTGTGVVTATVPATGIAGGLYGSMTRGSITRCFATIEVNGGDNVGGLVGQGTGVSTTDRVNISECYATGSVTGKANVGGLVGSTSYGAINDCFAAGRVTSTTSSVYAAGINGNASNTTVKNCYAVGRLSTNGSGVAYGGTATNSYFDSTAAGKTTPSTQARTTEQMTSKETYAGWDFTNTWSYQEGTYPILRNVVSASLFIPFDLTFRDLTCYSVVIEWPDIPGVIGYEISYLGKIESLTMPQALLDNLESDTEYEFKVRAISGTKAGVWSNSLTIKTKKMGMSGLHSTSKTQNTITLTWDEMSGAKSYEVLYQNKILQTESNTVTITGLSADTPYVIRVKAIMADGSVTISRPITEKIYTLDPQTAYARTFIDQCEGQTWLIDEIENILNLKGRSINTIKSREELNAVIAIDLANRGISGTIPPAIGELRKLEYLYLEGNDLSGELPDELYTLDRLVEMDLSGNHFITD